jgi:hypothetical protein
VKTGGFKWWHGVIIVAAVAAVSWGAFRTLARSGDGVRFATELLFIDVTTGDLFTFDVSGQRAVVVPEKNPESGKLTLLGVEKHDDGKWYIRERHLPMLVHVKDDLGAVVDGQTGEVRPTSERARRGR